MKTRILAVGLAGLLLAVGLLLIACGTTGRGRYNLTPGTWEARAWGFEGYVYVTVVTDARRMVSWDFRAPNDTEEYVMIVRAFITPQITAAGNFDVDSIAGATATANGLINAGRAALDQARLYN